MGPIPVTIPAPGASPSCIPSAASGDSSRKAAPGSSRRSIRSRTGSLPRSPVAGDGLGVARGAVAGDGAVRARSSSTSVDIAAAFARASSDAGSSRASEHRHRRYWTRRSRTFRAITSRWIWLVPSPISVSFASRRYRSTLYSST